MSDANALQSLYALNLFIRVAERAGFKEVQTLAGRSGVHPDSKGFEIKRTLPNAQCWRKTAVETQNDRLGHRGRYCLTGRVLGVVVFFFRAGGSSFKRTIFHYMCVKCIALAWRFLQKILNCCPGGEKAKFTSVPKVADGWAGFRLFWLWEWTRIRIARCFGSRKVGKRLWGCPEKVFFEEQEIQDSLRSELEAQQQHPVSPPWGEIRVPAAFTFPQLVYIIVRCIYGCYRNDKKKRKKRWIVP